MTTSRDSSLIIVARMYTISSVCDLSGMASKVPGWPSCPCRWPGLAGAAGCCSASSAQIYYLLECTYLDQHGQLFIRASRSDEGGIIQYCRWQHVSARKTQHHFCSWSFRLSAVGQVSSTYGIRRPLLQRSIYPQHNRILLHSSKLQGRDTIEFEPASSKLGLFDGGSKTARAPSSLGLCCKTVPGV
jgi:hypothetical protein